MDANYFPNVSFNSVTRLNTGLPPRHMIQVVRHKVPKPLKLKPLVRLRPCQ